MRTLGRFKGLVAFLAVTALLFGALVVGKNAFLRQAEKRIRASLVYDRLRLSYFPPSLVLENVRSPGPAAVFAARRISIGISYVALLRKEKPLILFVEGPTLRLAFPSEEPGSGLLWPLPFAVEKGIVRDADITVALTGGVVRSVGVRARFSEKGDAFTFQAESGETTFTPSAGPAFGGAVTLSLSGRGRDVTVHRAVVEGEGFVVKAEGRLRASGGPGLELATLFNVETGYVLPLLKVPFAWKGRAEGTGVLSRTNGGTTFRADLSSRGLFLNGVALGRASGTLSIDGTGRGQVDLAVPEAGVPGAAVLVKFGGGLVEGRATGTRLDPIIRYVNIPWPVRSPVWGTFAIEKGRLRAEGEFRDAGEEFKHPRYPFRGAFELAMDLQTKELTFASPGIESSFGRFEVRGGIRVGRDCDVTLRGEVQDVAQGREFTAYVIDKALVFPAIRGRGTADIRIAGDLRSPRVTAEFYCLPAGFAKFDAAAVEGSIDIQGGNVTGTFDVSDPGLGGRVGLAVSGDRVEADLRLDDGEVGRILPPLDIPFPLRGRASGRFRLVERGADLELTGTFAGRELSLLGQPLRNCRGGLEWRGNTLRLTGLSLGLYGGEVEGDLAMSFPGLGFDMALEGRGLRLSEARAGLGGTLDLGLKGKGTFGTDRPSGPFEVKDIIAPPVHAATARGEWSLGYDGERLGLGLKGGFLPGGNEFQATVDLPLAKDEIAADIKGSFDDIDRLLPWGGAKGRLNYLGEVRGPRSAPLVNGVVDVQGSLLPLPGFAHALTDFTGLAFFREGRVSLRSFQGKLGGGDLRASGTLDLGAGGVRAIDIRADGTGMLLSPLARTRALTSGWARLLKDERTFVLSGELDVSRLSWRRELTERLAFASAPRGGARPEAGFLDGLALDIRLRAPDSVRMENSLGRISGRFDLMVGGTLRAPVLLGEIEAVDGEITFQDRKFRVVRGRLSFFNPTAIEPYLDFLGETFVKDYRVTFALNGLVEGLRPEFSSSPPLPPEDVLALLALGESFRRTYSYDTTTRLSTASLLSFQIADQARKRAEGLFSLARFRVDPFVMGSSSEMSARLTVGRQLSRNVSILYSTNLTTQREEIVRMEWEIGRDFSLVAMRNEWGRISFDVKVRKRF